MTSIPRFMHIPLRYKLFYGSIKSPFPAFFRFAGQPDE
jgi:hypothetical protein